MSAHVYAAQLAATVSSLARSICLHERFRISACSPKRARNTGLAQETTAGLKRSVDSLMGGARLCGLQRPFAR